ncbi:MAG: type II toxin-antitoxin system RelE/ParE family toxin, partial [Bacteroidota bacterium]|nr:type II toxin-antitoxin system RelE/ParE family toxin [Bacteroidota bacterium]
FFDKGKLVVLANGFCKKSQKTPKKEIEKALKIKREYENEKK